MFIGIVMGLLASASWAAANVFVQRSGRRVGPFRALMWAQLVGIAALVPLALLVDERTRPASASTALWAAIAAVAAVVAYPCLFYSSERGRLSVVVPVMSSWSVVSAGISLGLLGESLRPGHWVGAGLVVLGVVVVSRFSLQRAAGGASEPRVAGAAVRSAALWAAMGAALGFGVVVPAIDVLSPAVGRLGAIALVFGLDLLLGVPIALLVGVNLRPPSRAAWPSVAAAGLFEALGFVWIAIGISHAPVAVVSPLAGLSSGFTVLFASLVLKERPRPQVLLGAALACVGVVALAL